MCKVDEPRNTWLACLVPHGCGWCPVITQRQNKQSSTDNVSQHQTSYLTIHRREERGHLIRTRKEKATFTTEKATSNIIPDFPWLQQVCPPLRSTQKLRPAGTPTPWQIWDPKISVRYSEVWINIADRICSQSASSWRKSETHILTHSDRIRPWPYQFCMSIAVVSVPSQQAAHGSQTIKIDTLIHHHSPPILHHYRRQDLFSASRLLLEIIETESHLRNSLRSSAVCHRATWH